MVRADESFLVAGDGFSCTENFSNQDVWELTDNLSWFQGRHQLTFGTHTELIRTTRLTLIQPLGHWEFASLDSLEQGLPEAYFGTRPQPGAAGGAGGGSGNQSGRPLRPGPVGRHLEPHPDGRPADGRAVLHLEPGEKPAAPVGAGDRQLADTERQHPVVAPARVQLRPRRKGILPRWSGAFLRPAGVPLDQLGLRHHRTRRV